jgi:hypothetical protein
MTGHKGVMRINSRPSRIGRRLIRRSKWAIRSSEYIRHDGSPVPAGLPVDHLAAVGYEG